MLRPLLRRFVTAQEQAVVAGGASVVERVHIPVGWDRWQSAGVSRRCEYPAGCSGLPVVEQGPAAVRPYCPAAQFPGMIDGRIHLVGVPQMRAFASNVLADTSQSLPNCRWTMRFHWFTEVVFRLGGT